MRLLIKELVEIKNLLEDIKRNQEQIITMQRAKISCTIPDKEIKVRLL